MSDVLAFIGCFILFVGGILLLGNADLVQGAEGYVFLGGIVCIALSFFIPVQVLRHD
jgi:hypothetical protein